jgi:DNA modification methylase
VFKVGDAPPIDNVRVGRGGRNRRSNVWGHSFQNGWTGIAKGKLGPPAAKPVTMIADAIRDCTNRGGFVLDPFGGVGTTLIAAERSGRRARVIERDPRLVDASIERWQGLTGKTAVHADTSQPFRRSGERSVEHAEHIVE